MKTTTIEQLWLELESEARAGTSGAWISRFALPESGNRLLVAIETSTNRRAVLLPLPSGTLPARRDWPHCRGLEVFALSINGVPNLGVRLNDDQFSDVFGTLAEDVARRVSNVPDDAAAAAAFVDRLRRWQKFLAARSASISVPEQRGLFGELLVMRNHVLREFGPEIAVRSWRAPQASHQDFQFPSASIEVKTTTEKQPQAVRITSERQLDGTGSGALFLIVVILDEREIEVSDEAMPGESLPDIVADLRERTTGAPRLDFDDRLLDLGYLDAEAPRLSSRRFTLRNELAFRVHDSFPRILERELPMGVGNVSYDLSLAACQPFLTTADHMMSVVSGRRSDP